MPKADFLRKGCPKLSDKERLDWLQANYGLQKPHWYGRRSLRDAIDISAEMSKDSKVEPESATETGST